LKEGALNRQIRISEPPQAVEAELARLRTALLGRVPKTRKDNLLVATWNLREFGALTQKWRSSPKDSPKRDFLSIHCIAEIVSRFDVVAIQEVQADLTAMNALKQVLDDHWTYIVTDVTRGSKGNGERLWFLFNQARVVATGLMGEIVVPADERGAKWALKSQFARSPFSASFASKLGPFTLTSAHIVFGGGAGVKQRAKEIGTLADWLSDWNASKDTFGENLILLGDFNIDRAGDPCYDAFVHERLFIPPALHDVPRTITDDPKKPSTRKFYDQIAWFCGEGVSRKATLSCRSAGTFDFRGVVMRGLETEELSWRMSDHLPLWVEFG
jgi:endonuclease/exonuclease/phosphatase family metal-dependent hydrolase